MTVSTYVPRSEVMANWSYHLMRMSWKVTDIFRNPANVLDEFGIETGWTIIDYGCGPGRYLKKASEKVGEQGKVYAVDVHDIAINCAREVAEKNDLSNVFPVKAFEYFVPIPEDSADLIYVLDVFHMVQKPSLFLQELHRLIKPGGSLILEDGHQKREQTLKKVLASKRWKIREENKKHLNLIPVNKLIL